VPAAIDVGSVVSASAGSGATSISVSGTCNAPNNFLIALEWNYSTGGGALQAPFPFTYNGVQLPYHFSISDAIAMEASFWMMPNPPTGGPYTLQATYPNGPVTAAAIALLFASGVDTSTSGGSSTIFPGIKNLNSNHGASSNNGSLTFAGASKYDLRVAVCGNGCTSQSSGPSQFSLAQQAGINGGYSAIFDLIQDPSSAGFTWANSGSATSNEWMTIGAVLLGLIPPASSAIGEQMEF